MTEEKTRNIHQRMLAASQRVGKLYKLKPKELPYHVVSYDQVVDEANAALAAEGVYWMPCLSERPEWDGGNVRIELYVNFFDVATGESISVPGFGLGMDRQDKAPGKAYTYAVKSALMKALHMQAGDEDPDLHNMESKESTKRAAKPAPKKKTIEDRISDGFEHFKLSAEHREYILLWMTGEVDIDKLDADQRTRTLQTLAGWTKDRTKLDEILASIPKKEAANA